MELVIALAIIGVGLIWYYNSKSRSAPTNTKSDHSDLAPYKIESPVVTPIIVPPEPSKPADDRVEAPAPVAQVDASVNWPFPQAQPVAAKPEKKKTAPRDKKTAEPKKVKAKPAAMTAAAKKPRAKKPAAK